jgi:hypothetical protein
LNWPIILKKLPVSPLAVILIEPAILLVAALTIGLSMSVSTHADNVVENKPEWKASEEQSLAEEPLRIALGINMPALMDLPSAAMAAADQLASLEERKRQGLSPLQIGFERSLPRQVINITLDDALVGGPVRGAEYLALEGSEVTWSSRIRVAGAFAFRIHLEDVELPPSAHFWVYNAAGESLGPFGANRIDSNGDFWLPPLEGSNLYLEMRVSVDDLEKGANVRFTLHQISELVSFLDDTANGGNTYPGPEVWTDCEIDISCEGGAPFDIDSYARGVARLMFINDGGGSWLCSGGLVSDKLASPSWEYYLLTANHCFDSETEAASLTAYFDYRSSTCGGNPPSLGSVPQSNGADLLATNAGSDFTFVRLDSSPGGARFWFGWTTSTPTAGQTFYSISNPAGQKLHYTTTSFNATGGITCSEFNRPAFHYSSGLTGSTTGEARGRPCTTQRVKSWGSYMEPVTYRPGTHAPTQPSTAWTVALARLSPLFRNGLTMKVLT